MKQSAECLVWVNPFPVFRSECIPLLIEEDCTRSAVFPNLSLRMVLLGKEGEERMLMPRLNVG